MFQSIDILSDSAAWSSGFEAGIVYTLMSQGVDKIAGSYSARNSEQLFLMASQLGYRFDWKESPKDEIVHIMFEKRYKEWVGPGQG